MNYHWEYLSVDQLVLFEEGKTQTRSIPMRGVAAEIIKLGPYMGDGGVKYRADGPLVNPSQDFDTKEEAMRAVEAIVSASGHAVDEL